MTEPNLPEPDDASRSGMTLPAAVVAPNPPHKDARPPFSHTYAGTAWFAPQAGVVMVVALSAFNADAATATIGGVIAWLFMWLLSGALYGSFTSPAKANARSHGELTNKLATLEAKLATLEARRDQVSDSSGTAHEASETLKSACNEATAHLTWVTEQSTSDVGEWRWVNGAGYITIWERLHRAEEALLRATSPEHLLDEALYDELRLRDSAIPNREDLMAILRAVKQFRYKDPAASPMPRPAASSADLYIQTDEEAASALTDVRFTINDFRDSSWNGLLQLRNQTMTTLLLTNATLFAFVVAAVIAGARGPAMLAATVFYLAGAAVGLFSRLNKQFQAQAAVEDYGLSNARLVAIPVYSGLAAIAGVVITSVAGVATGSTAPVLSTLFSLPPATGLLVVAAAFGAAPDLVLSRLADASEKFKSGIASTEPGNRLASG